MSYRGDIALGATIEFTFTTRKFSTGAPFALAGTPSVEAYQTGSSTPITAGITLTADYSGVTGLNHVSIAATGGNGFATAKDVSVVIAAGTVDSVSVVGETIASFSIENRVAKLANAAHGGVAAVMTLERIVVASTTSNEPAIKATGNGTGVGVLLTGGLEATGAGGKPGIKAVGGAAGAGASVPGIHAIGGTEGGAGFGGPGVLLEGSADGGNFAHGLHLKKSSSGSGTNYALRADDAVSLGSTLAVAGTTSFAAVTTTGTVTMNALTVTNATTLTGALTATNAANDFRGVALTSAYDYAKGTTAVTESYRANGAAPTPVQFMCEVLAHLGEASISGTTKTIKKLDHSTDAETFTLDDATNPASITRAS